MENNLEKTTDCIYYILAQNKDSTTFQHIKSLSYKEALHHKLYKCTICPGYTKYCCEYTPNENQNNGWRKI